MNEKLGYLVYVVVIIVIFGLIFCRGALVDEKVAIEALDKQGYSNIEIIDHDYLFVGFFGCDEHDAAKFTATAKNPAGREVEIFVCTGWLFKGATIRTR